jgi:hypothetical protein
MLSLFDQCVDLWQETRDALDFVYNQYSAAWHSFNHVSDAFRVSAESSFFFPKQEVDADCFRVVVQQPGGFSSPARA